MRTEWKQRLTYGHANGTSDSITAGELVITGLVLVKKKDFQLIKKRIKKKYSRVSFCDSSFYDDSLLRPLSSRTEYSRLVVHHCRNSSVLSLLSALLDLFRCACVSYFAILVTFF